MLNKFTFIIILFFCCSHSVGLSPTTSKPTIEIPSVTDVQWQRGECPNCGKTVSLAKVSRIGIIAGVDADLFTRSVGPQPEFYLINTCPNCLFSGYLSDFELVLPQQIKTLLKKKLKSSVPIKSTTKPREIPPLVKYELGYEAYKILGRSDEAMAWMALRASWVARDEYCNLPRNPQLADVLIEAGKLVPLHDKNMNPARRELDQAKALENIVENTAISPDMRWAYRSVIALLYRRHGENEKSLSYLNEVQRSNKAPSDVRIAITEMKDSLVSETKWQTLSAGHFHSAITKGKISPQNLTVAKYLLGVLYFRLGMEQDALVWFKSAEKDQPLPVPIDQWIQQFKGRMK